MKTRHKTSVSKTPRPAHGPRHPAWRHNGNIARLPKATRDKINQMLDDGFTYAAIIESLGDAGKGLDHSNFTHWKNGGYKDWLAEQAFIAHTRARQETPAELVRDFDGTDVNHAALQLGTLHIYEALRKRRQASSSHALDPQKTLGGRASSGVNGNASTTSSTNLKQLETKLKQFFNPNLLVLNHFQLVVFLNLKHPRSSRGQCHARADP